MKLTPVDRVDYEAIRGRMSAFQEVLTRDSAMSPIETKTILKARANALAEDGGASAVPADRIEIVGFMHGQERYGVELRYVKEVYPLVDPVSLPGAPLFILGIVNLRGRVLSVMDLGRLFDLPSRGVSEYDRIIVLNDEKMEFGLLCTEVLGMTRISRNALQPSLPTLTGVREKYLLGVTPDRMAVLAAGRMLSDSSLIVHEEA
jgi:purine-binding chemotaxis protein CheW